MKNSYDEKNMTYMKYDSSPDKAVNDEDLNSVNLLADDDESKASLNNNNNATDIIRSYDCDDEETVDPFADDNGSVPPHVLAQQHVASSRSIGCKPTNGSLGEQKNNNGSSDDDKHHEKVVGDSSGQRLKVRRGRNDSSISSPIKDLDETSSTTSSLMSPATKTINNLSQSQQTTNLRYDLSQLDELSKSNRSSKEKQKDNNSWTEKSTQQMHPPIRGCDDNNIDCVQRKKDANDDSNTQVTNEKNRSGRPMKSKSQLDGIGSSSINSFRNKGIRRLAQPRNEANAGRYSSIPIQQTNIQVGKVDRHLPARNNASDASETTVHIIVGDQELLPNRTALLNCYNKINYGDKERNKENSSIERNSDDEKEIKCSEKSRVCDAKGEVSATSHSLKPTPQVSRNNHEQLLSDDKLSPTCDRNKLPVSRYNRELFELNSDKRLETGEAAVAKKIHHTKESVCTSKGRYEIRYITIDMPGSLGLNIGSAKPSDEVIATVVRTQSYCTIMKNNEPISRNLVGLVEVEKSMIVTGLMEPNSLGGDSGIQVDDWLFYLENRKSKESQILHLDYEMARDVAKQGIRPLSFAIVRWSPESIINMQGKAVTVTPLPGAAKSQSDADKGAVNVPGDFLGNKSSGQSSGDAAPFCMLCNQTKNVSAGNKGVRAHHAWCPRNPHFKLSGAHIVYERVRMGVELGCEACLMEFSKGRLCTEDVQKHSRKCKRKQEETKQQEKLLKKKKKKSKNSAKTAYKKDKKRKVSRVNESQFVKKTKKRFVMEDNDTHDSSTCEEDSVSCDEHESVYNCQSKRPIHRLVPGTRSKLALSTASCNKEVKQKKKTKLNNRKSTEHASRKRQRRVCANEVDISKNANDSLIPGPPDSSSRIRCKTTVAEMDESVDDDSSEKLDINWESCENPWGDEGHIEGDVVIFSSIPGFGQVETLNPEGEPRFTLYPFSVQSQRYNFTHHTPEEGFQSIVLQRNALATRPWGFSVYIHEFGGACLVSDVDLLSPAATATFLGSGPGQRAPLFANDMIIEINGKRVGGMTLFTLTLELEVCGPRLTLLVSRYKYADEIRRQIIHAETSYLKALDEIINDDRRLDWADIGATTTELEVVDDAVCPIGNEIVDKQKNKTVSNLGCKGFEETGQGREAADYCDTNHVSETRANDRAKAHSNDDIQSHRDSQGEVFVARTSESDEGQYQMNTKRNSKKSSDREGPVEGQRFDSAVSNSEFSDEQSQGSDVYSTSSSSVSCKNRKTLFFDESSCSSVGSEGNNSTLSSEKDREYFEENDTESDKIELEDEEEDGNVLFNCVCGVRHDETIPVFWIQCENCHAWFNTASKCIGFTEAQAPHVEHWTCPGCPDVSIRSDQQVFSNVTESPEHKEYLQSCSSNSDPFENKVNETTQVESLSFNCEHNEFEWLKNAESRWLNDHSKNIADGCIRNEKNKRKNQDGTWSSPRGNHPSVFDWDASDGLWRPIPVSGRKTDRKNLDVVKTLKTASRKYRKTGSKNLDVEKTSKSLSRNSRKTENVPKSEERVALGEWYKTNSDDVDRKFDGVSEAFKVGDIVQIQAHSWPGVDNPSGLAKVVEAYLDDDGDQMYDIKYFVDRRLRRGVLARYVSKNRAF